MYDNQPHTKKEQIRLEDIERKIRNNEFDTKDNLIQYLNDLRNNGDVSELDSEKIEELLNLFDSLHTKEEFPLDLNEYSNVKMENQDLIISQKNDRVINTLEGTSEFTNEFNQTQNEIVANNNNGYTNADQVFEYMADNQKLEQQLIPLSEAILRNNISIETLQKIRFFATNSKINPNTFKVNPETGIFYNLETKEAYEVRKNYDTKSYEIYSGNSQKYGHSESFEEEPTIEEEKEAENMSYEATLNKPKKRVLKKEDTPHINNAAFTKIGLLIINIITFALLITMAVLLNK